MTRGFTLLETMVAVTILTLSVAGPLYVADRALVAAQISRDQLTASYLAQEGIEYIRSMRDHEFLYAYGQGGTSVSQDAWNAFVSGSGGSGTGSIVSCENRTCALDPFLPMGFGGPNALTLCASGGCVPLYLAPDGTYRQSNVSGSTVTPFVRSLSATLISANNLQVRSMVTWVNRGTNYTVTATDNLTPWR